VQATSAQRRRGTIAMASAAIFIFVALVLSDLWWQADASENARLSYKLPELQLALQPGNVLHLDLTNPNDMSWRQFRSELQDLDRLRLDDLVPDHGHIMHLFLVSMPGMQSFWHLHPEQLAGHEFSVQLPSLAAGHYKVFADIVHHTGFPETEVGDLDVSVAQSGVGCVSGHDFSRAENDTTKNQHLSAVGQRAAPAVGAERFNNQKSEISNQKLSSGCLSGDDSGSGDLKASDQVSQLSNGYRMVWEHDSAPLKTNQATWFRFRVEDKNGNPASDLEPYMGMAGHAVFIRKDAQIFAHVHPAGSVSMAAVELAQGDGQSGSATMTPMQGMSAGSSAVSCPLSPVPCSEVTFPYGFPQPGDYHIFVQIKRAGKIETGSFLARVR
jgi:hypothetical protein